MRAVWAALVLTACNAVFGIHETTLLDGGNPDRDDDSYLNEVDNCPDAFNNPQRDEDSDGIGDACDICPLTADTDQADSDGDGIGDHCDPAPLTAGDCLVVFDSFADPVAFPARYATSAGTTAVTPMEGLVHLDSQTTVPIHIVALDADGASAIQVLADIRIRNADDSSIGFGLDAALTGRGLWCEANGGGNGSPPNLALWKQNDANAFSLLASPLALSTIPSGTFLLARFDIGDSRSLPRCRIDHGVAVGFIDVSTTPLAGGAPAIRFDTIAGDVLALAIYRREPGGCTQPEVRR